MSNKIFPMFSSSQIIDHKQIGFREPETANVSSLKPNYCIYNTNVFGLNLDLCKSLNETSRQSPQICDRLKTLSRLVRSYYLLYGSFRKNNVPAH